MLNVRSRLLILLVLASVASAAICSTAQARSPVATPTTARASLSAARPGAAPATGEPDVGLVPKPAVPAGVLTHPPQEGGAFATWLDRVRLVLQMWVVRYLGAS